MERNSNEGITSLFDASDIVQSGRYSNDITQQVLSKARALINTQKSMPSKHSSANSNQSFDMNKIFIVHGRDDSAKTEVARFVEKLGYSAIILHEQVNAGKTIIEKIDEHTNVGFALVLYTPCDIGGLFGEENLKNRARQNVVFEHGYLLGKLGRDKVCALVRGDVEPPSDISGVVYVPLDDHGAWKMKVVKEMQQLGYAVDMNKAL
ncbi:nucleotide-binding protein [Undibacterium sp. 14-3-2]|nr:nucleotide-binding protein [Undibacterium sp. 14-3-2]